METLVNIGLVIVVMILLYPGPLGRSVKKAIPVLAVLSAAICITAYGLWNSGSGNRLEIRALDQKNSASEGTEIWLQSVRIDGVDYAPGTIFSEGWFEEDGFLKWRSYDQPYELDPSITAEIPAGAEVDLLFDSCKWRGLVEVKQSKAVSWVIDCYAQNGRKDGRVVSYQEARSLRGLRISGKMLFAAVFVILMLAALVFRLLEGGKSAAKNEPQPQREAWLDILRVLSAFLVVIIHTVGTGFDANPMENEKWMGYLFLNSVTRCAVPLFLMISGILLLGKQPVSQKVFRNVKKALLLLLVWNIAYILLQRFMWGSQKNIVDQILNLPVSRGPSGHLWYSYFLVWMYLFHPILYMLHHALSRQQRIYFVMITLAIPGVLDFYQKFFNLGGPDFLLSTRLCMTPAYMGLMVLGRLIYEEVKPKRSMAAASMLMIAIGLGGAMLVTRIASVSQGKGTDRFLMETRLLPVCYAAGVLGLGAACRNLLDELPDPVKRFFKRLSGISLGIYFFHCAVIWMLGDFRFAGFAITRDGGFGEALCCAVIYYAMSVACVSMMTYIPGLRKLVK